MTRGMPPAKRPGRLRDSRVLRLLVLSSTVLGLTLGFPAAQAQEPSPSVCLLPPDERPEQLVEPVELCGATTIETSTTSRVRVEVPADATIDLNPAPALTGEGRFIGFLLTEPATRNGFYAQTIRYTKSLGSDHDTRSAGHKAVEDQEQPSGNPTDPPPTHSCTECHVPPGLYDLYVISDGSPVSVTLELAGLQGSLDLSEEDLTSVFSRQVTPSARSGNLGLTGQHGSLAYSCCFEMGDGVAFTQLATKTDTDALARATHTVCVRTQGASECDLGFSRHSIVGVASPDGLIGWSTQELAAGSYAFTSAFDATNTLGSFSWQVDAAVLLLAY